MNAERDDKSKRVAREKPATLLADIGERRRRARQPIERDAVVEGYKADRSSLVKILNQVLATEIVCVLRDDRHHHMASGIYAQAIAQELSSDETQFSDSTRTQSRS